MTKVKDSNYTVLWWIGWIALTIISFFVSCYFWTGIIAKHFGSMDKPGMPILWVATVFGTWMIMLVPLIIVMYSKVDKTYEDSRINRETIAFNKAKAEFKVKSILIKESDRELTRELRKKLKKIPEAIHHGHLVTISLRDGRSIPHVFIMNNKEVLGVYGVETLDFRAADILDFTATDLDKLPVFKAENWLRLDGVGGA